MSHVSTPSRRPTAREQAAPERPPANEKADLDTRIHAAELAVIRRDENVRSGIRQIADNLRQHSGLGLAVAGGIMLLALRPGHRHEAAQPAKASSAMARSLPLIYALEKLWPMVPVSLRKLVPPGIPELLFGFVLPIVHRLFPGRKADSGSPAAVEGASRVRSAQYVDLRRYLGRWYEIARLPTPHEKGCVSDVTASYGVIGKRGPLSVLNQCRQANGQMRAAGGVARLVDGESNARLKVSFAPRLLRWLPWVWSDYWILMVDTDYRYALVGTPDRRRLWLLSRTPSLADADHEQLIACARAQGYDTAALKPTAHRK